MLLHKHHRTIAHLNQSKALKYLIRDYFALPTAIALMPALLAKGYGQADLVLCLLRLRDAHSALRRALEAHIAALVGHAIVSCPSCLLAYRSGPTKVVRSRDDRRITYVYADNPRQPGTEAHMRWCEYRVGRTLGQLYVRGVSKRDVRRAITNGWVKVEEAA